MSENGSSKFWKSQFWLVLRLTLLKWFWPWWAEISEVELVIVLVGFWPFWILPKKRHKFFCINLFCFKLNWLAPKWLKYGHSYTVKIFCAIFSKSYLMIIIRALISCHTHFTKCASSEIKWKSDPTVIYFFRQCTSQKSYFYSILSCYVLGQFQKLSDP